MSASKIFAQLVAMVGDVTVYFRHRSDGVAAGDRQYAEHSEGQAPGHPDAEDADRAAERRQDSGRGPGLKVNASRPG
jgi:hypothetical protein